MKEVLRIGSQKGDFPFEIKDVAQLLGLRVRRPAGNRGVYTDCPICGDQRGKLFVNYEEDVFRCNYCDAHGGMLDLYAMICNTDIKTAFRQIIDALGNGTALPVHIAAKTSPSPPPLEQSPRASAREVHETLTLLFEMLCIYPHHERNLRERGLDEKHIKKLGYKSTPPPSKCLSLTKTLIDMGCTVAGVPGFYVNRDGRWTVNFINYMSGMLVPVKGMDRLIRGAQIRLDVPTEEGNKYVWFSSSTKYLGATSGSPAHFVGNPYARTVYLTEGTIKADVANYFMNRTFLAVAGANNLVELEDIFPVLAKNGTVLIVEAHDIDKYRNVHVKKAASRIYNLAREYKMDCKRLTWNPNYKGIDDWQLHLRRRTDEAERMSKMTFKERYLEGLCDLSEFEEEVNRWHRMPEGRQALHDFLGITKEECAASLHTGNIGVFLDAERKRQSFRLYQLELTEDNEVVPFAFADISVMRKKGKCDQPPAAKYRLVHDSHLFCPVSSGIHQTLTSIKRRFSDELPDGFGGRNVAPSDIIELYNNEDRRYYYCNRGSFEAVRFSPVLALPMKDSS